MPRRPPRVCSAPGCAALTTTGRCAAHPKARWEGRGSAASRGYGTDWRALRRRVLARDRYRCRACGAPASHVDHVVPKHQGGTDDEANLRSLCAGCHATKTAREGNARRRT